MNHEPKTAALLAYARGSLSEDGTRRLETHLLRCASCRSRLAAVRAAEGVMADIRALGAADLRVLDDARAERMVDAILRAPTHAPKLYALLALHDDALTEEGTRRIREHLDVCGICEEAFEAMVAYERVSGEIRDLLPPVGPDDLPPEALATIRPIGLGNRSVRWAGAALIAVAAAALLWWRLPESPSTRVAHPEWRAPTGNTSGIDLEPESLSATVAQVTAVIGDTSRCNDEPVYLGQLLELGAVCVTGAGDGMHVAFDERTGFTLAAGSGVEIHQAGDQGVLIELGWGEISSTVEHGRAYAVEAQGRRFEVRGTRFAVRHSVDGPSAARVVEGAVAVMPTRLSAAAPTEAAPSVTMLRADADAAADWSSDGSSTPPTVRDVNLNTSGEPLHLAPSEWSQLSVDGVRLRASGGLGRVQMLLPAESGALRFTDAYGNHATLPRPAPGAGSVRAPVHELRGSIPRAALRAAMPSFEQEIQRCVNRALRMQPGASGTAQLQLVVGADGHVVSANVLGAGAPVPLRTCLNAKARRWQLPAPTGGPRARVSLPVSF